MESYRPAPYWYKDAVVYELHVRAFHDSNDDGIGDFRGLTEKLDYLQELGVTALWLLPFYPSPLKDDGYDIADYMDIHPDYGSLRDFRELLRAAHRRGMNVIVELVLNHTSSEHAWFQRARRSPPGSSARNMYLWTSSPERFRDARIIFRDFEFSNWAWDRVAQSYYWHRFYSHQPDLNFDNPRVHRELFRVIDFWLEMGVDGLRLDAVPYLYERDGTNCENLPETHAFLKKLRAHVDARFENRLLLAEANQWPEDAAAYFGEGDECHMAFHFPIMPRMFMAIQMEDNFPLLDIIRSTPQVPQPCQWGTFLRNHDELTLEMVTDEERDYMYRVYAKDARAKINLGIRRRLAPLLGNDRRKIELMNILLFSLPGTPTVYYGDEIGMGDNYYLGDRNGVRTPMQWSPDLNAGFSRANPHRLYLPVIIDPEYHYGALNVRNQESNLSSLLWWMRSAIAMRRRHQAFGRGSFETVASDNAKVLSFIRQHHDQTVLVVANLSRFRQVVNLELAQHAGMFPEEVFGRTSFPPIAEAPYLLTLGPHDYYWLLLRPQTQDHAAAGHLQPALDITGSWLNVFSGPSRERLEEDILPRYVARARWFASKARRMTRLSIVEEAGIEDSARRSVLLILALSYTEGPDEFYLLPVSFLPRAMSGGVSAAFPQAIIAEVRLDGEDGMLYDGAYDEQVHRAVYDLIARKARVKGVSGEFYGYSGKAYRRKFAGAPQPPSSKPLKADQSNSSVTFGDQLFLKLYRKLDEGTNPELDMVRFLNEETGFPNTPPFAGAVNYLRGTDGKPFTIAVMQGFVENSGSAWTFTTGAVKRFFEQVLSGGYHPEAIPASFPPLMDTSADTVDSVLRDLVGVLYFDMVSLLGQRTAELHIALSSSELPEFKAEAFTLLYQRSVYQSMHGLVQRTLQVLARQAASLPPDLREEIDGVLGTGQRILGLMKRIVSRKISAMKIRIHGDYHLGQVLYTGKDFVIMDFEGEPARSVGERKLKRSPLRDVAGMIRSFHYAPYSALMVDSPFRNADRQHLEMWIRPWYHYVSGVFLTSYLKTAGTAAFIPEDKSDVEVLLQAYLLEKAVYELGYELNNRPDWVIIPLRGIHEILKQTAEA